ncbi:MULTISPECIES: TIR domain-containing protein [Alphaproteobacteria]|uniref:TIR domain-containing protein n=1 Tax=Sphingopyxis sp. TaxID=1908224 RepID=UPI004034BFFC
MSAAQELYAIVEALEGIAALAEDSSISQPIQARIDAANEVGKAFSGSWLGYHARVYQQNLRAVPGARFDAQWGLRERRFGDTTGSWAEYDSDEVKRYIRERSGILALDDIEQRIAAAERDFERHRGDALSILAHALGDRADSFLEQIAQDLKATESASATDAINYMRPKGQLMSSDMIALTGGLVTPPHVEMLAKLIGLTTVPSAAQKAADLARKAASHIERSERSKRRNDRVGTNVFIGHGRSLLWRELKDFIVDRLHLPADEFNRVPVGGVTNIARLSEMLDSAAAAFIIMTAEDETADGRLQARMNVIHEVGLFQGRLGFTKAIIMLEEGCEEFSNVQGLGQIRFPKGRISAAFEEVRQLLEREEVIVS